MADKIRCLDDAQSTLGCHKGWANVLGHAQASWPQLRQVKKLEDIARTMEGIYDELGDLQAEGLTTGFSDQPPD